MSNIADLFSQIQPFVPEELLSEFNLLFDKMKVEEPHFYIENFRKELERCEDDKDWDHLAYGLHAFREIHDERVIPHENVSATIHSNETNRWFDYLEIGLNEKSKPMVDYLLEIWPTMFTTEPLRIRKVCMSSGTKRCNNILDDGSRCKFSWVGTGKYICPVCGSPKRFCHSKIDGSTVRCSIHFRGTIAALTVKQDHTMYYVNKMSSQKVRLRYAEAVEQGGLNLDKEIGLLTMRIGDLVAQLNLELDYAGVYQILTSNMRRFRSAVNTGNLDDLERVYENVLTAVSAPKDDDKTWAEIRKTILTLKSLVETQRATIQANSKALTLDEMMEILGQTATAVATAVRLGSTDAAERLLKRIEYHLRAADLSNKDVAKVMLELTENPLIAQGDLINSTIQRQLAGVFRQQTSEQNKAIIIENNS